MSDQWFYRVFGEEFGPMPLEKLKELAESGTIQPLDDVRSTSGDWMPAVNVDEFVVERKSFLLCEIVNRIQTQDRTVVFLAQ